MLAELEPYLTADPYDVADMLESAPWDAAAHEAMSHYRGCLLYTSALEHRASPADLRANPHRTIVKRY